MERHLEAWLSRVCLASAAAVVAQLAAGFREEEWAMLVQRQRLQRSTTECRLQWTNSLAPTLRCAVPGCPLCSLLHSAACYVVAGACRGEWVCLCV